MLSLSKYSTKMAFIGQRRDKEEMASSSSPDLSNLGNHIEPNGSSVKSLENMTLPKQDNKLHRLVVHRKLKTRSLDRDRRHKKEPIESNRLAADDPILRNSVQADVQVVKYDIRDVQSNGPMFCTPASSATVDDRQTDKSVNVIYQDTEPSKSLKCSATAASTTRVSASSCQQRKGKSKPLRSLFSAFRRRLEPHQTMQKPLRKRRNPGSGTKPRPFCNSSSLKQKGALFTACHTTNLVRPIGQFVS